MTKMKTNQKMTMLTLVVALGVAVYLNWEYAKTTDNALAAAAAAPTASPAPITDLLAADAASADAQAGEAADKNYGEAQLVSVNGQSGDDFFEAARLQRSKTRDEALDALQKSLKSAKLTDEEKTELTARLTDQIESITTESDVESLIRAKGFVDCVAFINDGQVNITVMTTSDGLTASEVAQIRDIVLSKCSVSAQNITVVEVK